MLCISIPVKFQNKLLSIKALKLSGKGETQEVALLSAIKSTSMYSYLCDGEFETTLDKMNNDNVALIIPFNDMVLREIFKIEPLPEDKKVKKSFGLIVDPSSEETLKLGY